MAVLPMPAAAGGFLIGCSTFILSIEKLNYPAWLPSPVSAVIDIHPQKLPPSAAILHIQSLSPLPADDITSNLLTVLICRLKHLLNFFFGKSLRQGGQHHPQLRGGDESVPIFVKHAVGLPDLNGTILNNQSDFQLENNK